MSKKLVLLASVALVVLCGLMLVTSGADADAATDAPAKEKVTVTQGGCVYEVDPNTIDISNPRAILTAWDGKTVDIVIPSEITVTVVIGEEPEEITCGIEMKPINGRNVFCDNTTIKTLTVADGKPNSVILAPNTGSSYSPQGAFNRCTGLTTVKIGTSVEKLPLACFQYCSNIATLTLSEGLKTIDGKTLCAGYSKVSNSVLKTLVIPDSVTYIGNEAFKGCAALETVTFGTGLGSTGYGVFNECVKLQNVTLPPNLTKLGGTVFRNCELITDVVLNAKLTDIGDNAFNNTNITEVNIPEGMTLSPNVFANFDKIWSTKQGIKSINVDPKNTSYKSLEGMITSHDGKTLLLVPGGLLTADFTVPAGIEVIGDKLFSSNRVLVNVILPDSIRTIGEQSFNRCGKLETITNLGKVTSFGAKALSNTALTEIDLSGITDIPESICSYCSNLKTVTFSPDLKTIGDSAFRGCESLVMELKDPDGKIDSIGPNAFSESGLKSVELGTADHAVKIAAYSFWDCNQLTSVVFKNIDLAELDPNDYGRLANGAQLSTITYPEGFDLWKTYGGIQYSNDGTTIYCCLQNYDNNSHGMIIPAEVTKIMPSNSNDPGAFTGCHNLQYVKFDNDRSEPILIGYWAFRDCKSLKAILLADNAIYQDFGAGGEIKDGYEPNTFRDCNAVKYIEFGNRGDQPNYIYEGYTNYDHPDNVRWVAHPGTVWVGTGADEFGEGTFYRVGMTDTAIGVDSDWETVLPIPAVFYDVEKNGFKYNLTANGIVMSAGSVVLTDKGSITGTYATFNDQWVIDEFAVPAAPAAGDGAEPVPVPSIRIYAVDGVLDYDLINCEAFLGTYKESSRVTGLNVSGFHNDRNSLLVDVDSFTDSVPNGTVFVNYSVYTEYEGKLYIDPFRIKTVDVGGNSVLNVFVGEKIHSCSVSYVYDFAGMVIETPLSDVVSCTAGDNITVDYPNPWITKMTIDGENFVSGDFVTYGEHVIEVPDDSVYWTINGEPVEGKFLYYGQTLVLRSIQKETA